MKRGGETELELELAAIAPDGRSCELLVRIIASDFLAAVALRVVDKCATNEPEAVAMNHSAALLRAAFC